MMRREAEKEKETAGPTATSPAIQCEDVEMVEVDVNVPCPGATVEGVTGADNGL